MSKTVGIRVKARRKELSLTQTQLGSLCGLSQQTIQNIESGRNRSSGNLVPLADALQVRPQWLESGEGPMLDTISPDERELLEEYRQLEPEKRPVARMTLRAMLPAIAVNTQLQTQYQGQDRRVGHP